MIAGLRLALIGWLAIAPGCRDAGTDPADSQPEEITLDDIFAPATQAEISAISTEWAARSIRVEGVREEFVTSIPLLGTTGRVRVLSHLVDGNRHYGLVIVPSNAGSRKLPIVVFAHPGDNGVSLADVALFLSLVGTRASEFVVVVPSFRSEVLDLGAVRFQSEGAASPWDRDVDDALSLVDATIAHTPEADPTRIGVLGFSRGGGVALLMGIRDPRIDLVIEFAGPTDFFGEYVRRIVSDALEGRLANLPGVNALNQDYIQRLRGGTITLAAFRRELVRRSPVLFVNRLPPVQVHHGTADEIVHVSQAQSLISALERGGRTGSDQTFLYPNAGHNPLEMSGSISRALSFLDRLRS